MVTRNCFYRALFSVAVLTSLHISSTFAAKYLYCSGHAHDSLLYCCLEGGLDYMFMDHCDTYNPPSSVCNGNVEVSSSNGEGNNAEAYCQINYNNANPVLTNRRPRQ